MNSMRKILLLMIVLCSVVTVGLATYYLCYNVNLTWTFDKKETTYNYADEVEKKTLDLNKISSLFTDNVTLVGYPEFQDKIISPVSIEYYENIRDKSPVYVIEKGEVIYFEMFPKTKSGLEFRGNDSIPTNEKGWRLARPFKGNGAEKDLLLYVKLEDLIHVNKEWLRKNPTFNNVVSKKVLSTGLLPTKRNISKFMLLFVDRELYSNGIFLSKDMYKPIIDREVVISLFVAIILIALTILGKKQFRW